MGQFQHCRIPRTILSLSLPLASFCAIIRIHKVEILRRAAADRRRVVVAADPHVAAPPEDLALVGHRGPADVGGGAPSGSAVSPQIPIRIQSQEPHHVAALAVVAAVSDHGGARQRSV